MKRGLDTNVLVYAHLPGFPEHEAVRGFLLDQLGNGAVTLAVTPLVLHELVHVTTDGRRFDPPLSMSEALAVARLYLNRSNVECLAVDESALLRALEMLERFRLGRKRIADTLLVATLLENGVEELITCDVADFQVFDGLRLVDPRES